MIFLHIRNEKQYVLITLFKIKEVHIVINLPYILMEEQDDHKEHLSGIILHIN